MALGHTVLQFQGLMREKGEESAQGEDFPGSPDLE